MRIKLPALLLGSALVLGACEDGPELIFTPFEGEAGPQNGYENNSDIWVQDGEKGFDTTTGGDNVGRAKFCSESQQTEQIQQMVLEPIIPDVSAGGVPLWSADGSPLLADDLLGTPDEGKFCDPTGLFLDAFTWGPTDEVIVLFDQETRLVNGVIAYTQYLGTMEGSYTDGDGNVVPLTVKPRERLTVNGVELDVYTSRAQANGEPRSWLNNANVTALYKMVRETFFNADPFPGDFDCVEAQLCDLIFTSGNEAVPQDTFILIQDSGIQLRFTPEGQVLFVFLEPVRSAPFENGAALAFGAAGSQEMAFTYQSDLRQTCSIDLDAQLTWGQFKTNCIANGDERALERANYNVDTSRDAVRVEFNGVDLSFLHPTSERAGGSILTDGATPDDADVLYAVAFSRTLPAAVEEFRPQTLGMLYKRNLEAHLKRAIIASSTTAAAQHPFWNYEVTVPFNSDDPQRIGELLLPSGQSWIPLVLEEVSELYRSLTPAQREMVEPTAITNVALIDPFVDGVLEAFSHGESNSAGAFKAFRTTDDLRWSIGYAHFVRNGVPYRLNVQYSLNFGAVTFVSVERGFSEIDDVLSFAASGTYYQISDSLGGGSYGLGGNGIAVGDFDRQLDMLTVNFATGMIRTRLPVSGDPIEDFNGYNRQIRGERFEFIPANEVRVYGKESVVIFWVREDGTIGRINQGLFKGSLDLCPGLSIQYGDHVPAKLDAWSKTVSQGEYLDCEIVYNYSENGNVLDSIASLANRRSFILIGKRAVTASIWE